MPDDSSSPKPAGADLLTAAFFFTFPLTQITACASATLGMAVMGGPRIRAGLLAYIVWAYFVDKAPLRGGYGSFWKSGITKWLRSSSFWRWSAKYFPVTLTSTAPLPPEGGPYIFVCHPHGIIGISPMTHFGTEATGFSEHYPGVDVHLLGHSAIFRIPLFREWCLAHGHGSVDKKTCLNLLRRKHSIALAPGGAKESLECVPGTMRLVLEKRKGFAKLALQTGAALVPVMGFGENDVYSTVQFKQGSFLRKMQERLQSTLGFALPLFCGLKWAPLYPTRGHISTVVGAPLRFTGQNSAAISGSPEAEPSPEAVSEFHAQYCASLRQLFETHKSAHGSAGVELQFV